MGVIFISLAIVYLVPIAFGILFISLVIILVFSILQELKANYDNMSAKNESVEKELSMVTRNCAEYVSRMLLCTYIHFVH